MLGQGYGQPPGRPMMQRPGMQRPGMRPPPVKPRGALKGRKVKGLMCPHCGYVIEHKGSDADHDGD